MDAWGPYELRSATTYFPATAAEAIAVAVGESVDDAAADAALTCPGSDAVKADVCFFGDSEPIRHRTGSPTSRAPASEHMARNIAVH